MVANQIKTGVLLGYLNIFFVNVIGLFLTPFIIRCLGDSEFGLYSLIGTFVAYLSLMDLGLNNTIIRFVSLFRAKKDKSGEEQFLGTIMVIYGFISLAVVLLGGIMYYNIDLIFGSSLSIAELYKAKIMYLILIFNVVIVLPCGSFNAICTAYERFIFSNAIKIFRYLLRSATVICVLMYGGGAISIVIIDTSFNIIIALVTYLYTKKKLNIKYDFSQRDWGAIKHIFSYSIWIFLIAISQSLQWQAGQTFVGIVMDTVQVAVFAVGVMLGSYYGAFTGVLNTMLLPKASRMILDNSTPKQLTDTMIRVARFNNLLSFLILGGFIVFGQDFIRLWVGDTYMESWAIAVLVMLSVTVPLSQSFGQSILEAKMKIRFRSIFNTISLIVGVIIGFIMTKHYGIIGMATSICLALIINSIAINWYFYKIFNFRVFDFFLCSFFPFILCSFVLVGGVLLFKDSLTIVDNWFQLIFAGCIYVVLYIVTSFVFVLTKEERDILLKRS